MFIYILELVNGKYYVGKTINPDRRIEEHLNLNGSEWTKIYKPVRIIDIIEIIDEFDEDKHTLATMRKHGIDNVRGGSFSQCILSDSMRNTIITMLRTDSDLCYICGGPGHFAKQCNHSRIIAISDDKGDKLCKCVSSWVSKHKVKNCKLNKIIKTTGKIITAVVYAITEDDIKDELLSSNRVVETKMCCGRCGRNTHTQSDCFAVKHLKGYIIM